MKKACAFSLIEVVLALGILVFALVAILGLFPIGLDTARQSISDTRGQQLANAVFSAMHEGPYTGVKVYGRTLDLSTAAAAPVLWYAEYPDPSRPEITTAAGANSIYTLEASFAPPPDGIPASRATAVRLKIYPRYTPAGALHFVSLIGDY